MTRKVGGPPGSPDTWDSLNSEASESDDLREVHERPAASRPAGWQIACAAIILLLISYFTYTETDSFIDRRKASVLILAASSGEPGQKERARKSLGEMGIRSARAAADYTRGSDKRLRVAGLLACEQVILDGRARLSIMNCAFGIVPEQWGVDAALDSVGSALAACLADADPVIRLASARLLLMIPRDDRVADDSATGRAMAEIRTLMKAEGDPEARWEAIKILGENRPSLHAGAASVLIEAMKGEDERARREATLVLQGLLAEWGGSQVAAGPLKEAIPFLIRDAEPEDKVRIYAIAQLGFVGDPDILARIGEGLHSPIPQVRSSTAAVFARMASRRAMIERLVEHRPALEGLLEDPSADVRHHASAALRALRAGEPPSP